MSPESIWHGYVLVRTTDLGNMSHSSYHSAWDILSWELRKMIHFMCFQTSLNFLPEGETFTKVQQF